MLTFRIVTLGCKVSRADAAAVDRQLREAGLLPAPGGAPASVCVVCGCAVTGVAEGKSRRALARVRRENPGATVVAAGCIASRMREIGGDESARADAYITPVQAGDLAGAIGLAPGREPPGEPVEAPAPRGFPGRTRAVLKVQDGCDGSCAYCIVPRLRGAPRSRPRGEVLEEARALVDAGHREIVLTGVRLGAYRAPDAPGAGLADLVEGLLALRARGLVRVRLSSIEPMDLPMRLVDLAAHGGGLCPHFHLPLQSADDGVLARMRRPYDAARYRRILAGIRERVPDAAISTDLIAAFPGESPEAHARTVAFIAEERLARVHAFPFSPRPGTPAASMDGAVDVAEARRRTRALVEAGARAAAAFHAGFLGRVFDVIAEPGDAPGILAGYTPHYARVRFGAPPEMTGLLVRVRATRLAPLGFEGERAP